MADDFTTTSKYRGSLYLTDHLGSTRAVVDDGGNVLETFDYYPFGLLMPKRNTAGANTIEKFTGKERDEEGGLNLDYFGARYYDPALGRWHNPDPLADDYPSWSPYNYTLNNPLNLIDPDGKQVDCPECLNAINSFVEDVTESFNNFVQGINDYFASVASGITDNELQNRNDDNSAESRVINPPNPVQEAGKNTAETLSTTDAYVSISVSKADGAGSFPGYSQVIATSSGVFITAGADATASLPNSPPMALSFGIISKRSGGPVNPSDVTGLSSGVTGGAVVGFEHSVSQSSPFKFTGVEQSGIVISPTIWVGTNVGYTFELSSKE